MSSSDYSKYQASFLSLFRVLSERKDVSARELQRLLRQYKKDDGSLWGKNELLSIFRTHFLDNSELSSERITKALRKRPIRTQSGVAPITVLTKPFPCPGKCIFCPNDIRMPKSYLADEPGAQRAERNYFDPYLQVYNRLTALRANGHMVEKAEIIVLGGTWSFYSEEYQVWFIKECFRALNQFEIQDDRDLVLTHYRTMEETLKQQQHYAPSDDPEKNKKNLEEQSISGQSLAESYNAVISRLYTAPEKLGGFDRYQTATWEELETQQLENEQAKTRCVGLVVETRPDNISEAEVMRMRRLGCTKTQIGIQSLQDAVLEKNKRGHTVRAARVAIKLLRQAGFKIHAHWMANLYGSSVEQDKQEFELLFSDPDFCPDELKIYPCSLIGSAELMQYFNSGKWRPYSREELNDVLTHCIMATPSYCRLTRIIRDIPSTDIVEGNKTTNFRQVAERSLSNAGKRSGDIRAREVRSNSFEYDKRRFDQIEYETTAGQEFFLQAVAPVTLASGKVEEKLLGFVRLFLPHEKSYIPELGLSALIREVHVYGQAQGLGKRAPTQAQHKGLGTELISRAQDLAQSRGYSNLAVISAVGTREYYRKLGFSDGELYQHFSCCSDFSL